MARGHFAVVAAGGKIYVIGGSTEYTSLETMEIMNLDGNLSALEWEVVDMPGTAAGSAAVLTSWEGSAAYKYDVDL